jgi:translation initiation factor 2D
MLAVSPVPGKGAGSEVLVQGKHVQTVTELLLSKGVPKKWIEATDLSGKK